MPNHYGGSRAARYGIRNFVVSRRHLEKAVLNASLAAIDLISMYWGHGAQYCRRG